jgi:hypothetical protein
MTNLAAEPVTVLLNRMAIVLTGSFNPSIFHPSWFARNEILRSSEADAADVKMVNPQLAHFQAEWLEIQVFRNRFMALSRNGGYEGPLADLVTSTFRRLEHTPVEGMGLNREAQLQFDSVERWHKLGNTLTPKAVWGDVLSTPGMLALQMQGKGAGEGEFVNVAVTSTGERRADIDINDHRKVQSSADALRVLQESWQSSQLRSAGIVEHLTKLVK